MIAEWMLYAVAISLLLGGAALAVERACRLRRWPSRWIWALVLAAPFVLPFAARVVDVPPNPARPMSTGMTNTAAREPNVPAPAAQVRQRMHRLATSRGVASLLGVLWVCGSVSLAIGLGVSWLRMRGRSASWTRRTLDGTDILVADDIGPAVIGFWRPEIVVPKWLLSADPKVRRLALTHEREHVRMRDPLLLLAGTLSVVLLPWNLPLWWQWRRLRFAIEVDCDARVLASGRIADDEYAEALLNVAERSSEVPLAAAAMCESASTLEERIRVFLLDRTGRQRALALALLLGGIGVAAAATQIEAPAALSAQARQLLANDAIGAVLVETIVDGDHSSAVSLIDAGADVNRVVLGDGTPLIAASRSGDVPLVNLLIERGAEVDLAVRGDGSPLIAAAARGNMEIVATLVERGADVNGFVLGDETPLINASRAGKLEVVQYLVAKGADVNLAVPAEAGPLAQIRSPLGEALKHEHAPVAEYLRTQGAR
jgi:beta-lactamase regulating signal transducer with metallopeptidase domain/ankyrin repeat protein